jgi:predicted nucleic acid-binding protein
VIVVDTSAWVDFFRGRATPVASTLEHLIDVQADVAITETILMEVLAGATPGEALARIRAELIARPILRLEGLADFEEAAQIYRTCRSAGHTLRNQLDCLIAVPVIRHGASLLHNDGDFETIARHTALKLERLE